MESCRGSPFSCDILDSGMYYFYTSPHKDRSMQVPTKIEVQMCVRDGT